MNKPQIRKKIFNIRKRNSFKDLSINYNALTKVLNKIKFRNKSIGGYFPYNYEVDTIKILNKHEKKNYLICLPKIIENYQMDFYKWSS